VIGVRRFATRRPVEGLFFLRNVTGTPLALPQGMSEEGTAGVVDRHVEVLDTSMHIHELCIERPNIIAYLARIAPDKQEIALVHALEVGVTELIARRERFQR
jgi:hypothetical protein